jgi:diguanylate cyclase (GGDEF)-like protein
MFMTFSTDSGAPAADDEARLEELLAASDRANSAGHHREGAEHARDAADLAERLGRLTLQARASVALGMHKFRLGDNEASLAALHRALALYTELDDPRGTSAALNGMVVSYHELGLQEEALEHAARSLEAAKRSGDPLTLAWAYNRAGLGHASVGNITEGIVSMEFALSLAREAEDRAAIFSALNNLVDDLNNLARELLDAGAAEEARERIDRALELTPEALELAQAMENIHSVSIILLGWGHALALGGEYDRATELLSQAEEMAREGGYRPVLLETRHVRARLELDRGELRTAVEEYTRLLEDVEEARDALVLVDIHLSLWRAHKGLGEYREALDHHERFHELERAQQSELAKTRARILSSHLELDRAQLEARRAQLEAELERSRTRQLEAQAVALREETEMLSRRVDQDGLTGLWNRRHVEHELPRLLREAAVRGEPVSVAFVDADHFKSINDQFGHLVGDDVLRHLSDVLRANVRPTDVVARYGGEEFVVLLPGAAAGAAVTLGQRLCDAVRETSWEELVPGCSPTVTVGVADCYPKRMTTLEIEREMAELLGRADGALYMAKRAGRDRVALATADGLPD